MKLSNFLRENKLLLFLGLINFLLIYLSAFNKSYTYFIDELYYIACANRPAFGYVDHPPLAPFILTLFQIPFGDSVYALRFLPALASSAAVVMTGILTRELGGGKTAQLISAAAVLSVPVLLAFGGFYSMNAFEPLLTLIIFYLLIRMIKSGEYKRWIGIGVVIGLGIMNKHTFVLIALFVIISILLSQHRRILFNKYFLYSCLIALLMVVPNIIWQIQNNFPTLEFYRNITVRKNVYTPPVPFILGQILNFSPASMLIWLPGFIYFLFSRSYRQYRFIAIFFLISFLFFMFSGTSRSDRLSFVYPIIFTAGGIFWESITNKKYFNWVVYPLIILLLTGTALALPVILPYFNYEKVKAHTEFLGLNTELERGKKPPLPQLIADRIGWKEKADMVGAAFNTLSAEEKARTIVAGENYGQAGALELYDKNFGFPLVASGHNNYYLWSKGRLHGNILLQLGSEDTYNGLKQEFDSVYVFPAEFSSPYVSSHENNLRAYICRGPKISTAQMLENGKDFN